MADAASGSVLAMCLRPGCQLAALIIGMTEIAIFPVNSGQFTDIPESVQLQLWLDQYHAAPFIGGVMSLMSIWSSRFSARSLLGGVLMVVASASHAGDDQFHAGADDSAGCR